MNGHLPNQHHETDVGREMEQEFFRRLSEIVQKWEEAFAGLEESEQRRVVAAAAESGLLQAIQMARAALKRQERNGWRG
jgi:hypothetical protein